MADKVEDWFREAKESGLNPEAAKWAYRLARAKGLAVVADRTLRALESLQHAVDYALITTVSDASRQLLMANAPKPQTLDDAKGDLGAATELVIAAELILDLMPRQPPSLAVLGEPKRGNRFK